MYNFCCFIKTCTFIRRHSRFLSGWLNFSLSLFWFISLSLIFFCVYICCVYLHRNLGLGSSPTRNSMITRLRMVWEVHDWLFFSFLGFLNFLCFFFFPLKYLLYGLLHFIMMVLFLYWQKSFCTGSFGFRTATKHCLLFCHDRPQHEWVCICFTSLLSIYLSSFDPPNM